MKLKTKMKWAVVGLAALALFFGGFGVHALFTKPEPEPDYLDLPASESGILDSTQFRPALIEEIRTKQELITLEVALSEEIVLDDTWINWDIFKKNQRIVYKGTGLFTVDLGAIDEDSILIDDERKIVQVKLSAPIIKSIQIDEDKTEYFAVENGLLRSTNEISLTASEMQILMTQVKSTMQDKMQDADITAQAQESARKSVAALYQNILNEMGAGQYTVEIVFT